MAEIIKASGINKMYKMDGRITAEVLTDLDFAVETGAFVSIVGASGAGKSTLLHILGMIDEADSGSIQINLKESTYDYSAIQSDAKASIRNKHIGFVFQFHHLLPEFTAIENVMMPALIFGYSFAEARDKAAGLMNITGISKREKHKPSELSGGEQQRVAIARALINSPELVLADEPTGNLDKANTTSVLELLAKLQSTYNLTLIIATHSDEVSGISESVYQMSDGKIYRK